MLMKVAKVFSSSDKLHVVRRRLDFLVHESGNKE